MGRLFRKKGLGALLTVTVLFAGLNVPVSENGSVGDMLEDRLLLPLLGLFPGNAGRDADEDKSTSQLESEMCRLRAENRRLQDMLIDYYDIRAENEELRRFYDIKAEDRSLALVSARVIASYSTDGFCLLTLDKGRNDGIAPDDLVITENGLVGRVSETGRSACRVVTVLSPDVDIGAEIKRTGYAGMMSCRPSLADKGLCELRELSSQSGTAEGDIVVTSGKAGVYPANIRIGRIKELVLDPVTALPAAVIEPFENVRSVSSVAVITDFKGKGELAYSVEAGVEQ